MTFARKKKSPDDTFLRAYHRR